MGGIHKYDLTPDCTHLLVGEYDTPKYRHVAKERPDVKAMDARWVEAVRDLWVKDAEIDFRSLEKAWQLRPLETSGRSPSDGYEAKRGAVLCCVTGFEDRESSSRLKSGL
jgi:DNA replication regulator DPB11